ncbi:hypothetical protein OEA41_007679 [Lepraria neglecta]|uniref:SET domain-containing protein n=1 Tax=Lepraria neglecta TaxID=209136 RepID=A0AAD9ZD46_9LECA|nr:hypothetical protein OEA41_007679 [Lepraria neglecta]
MLPAYKPSSIEAQKQRVGIPTSYQAHNPHITTRQLPHEASPQSSLDIRTKKFSLSLSQPGFQPRQPSPSLNKRKIIDLTLSDDDEIVPIPLVPALKSTNSYGTVSAPRALHFVSKSTKVREKNPVFRSPYSQAASPKERVSAVQVPPLQPSPADCRRFFLENLSVLKGVTVVNTVDDSSPPLGFKFIKENVIGKGVHRATDEFMSGCTCRKDNGRQIGCEYLACECLEDSATTKDGKKVFPYSARKIDPGCLRPFYLQGGFHVFECNEKCNCMSNCLRCKVDLKTGQFIDTYRGEVITHEEAERRGNKRHSDDQENYFFSMDRWEDGSEGYVCDGMFMGGPTRFINHSCDPNCRQMTVSYNHADINIYDLAFFATEPIPAGTELTFDYSASVDEIDDADEDVEQSRVITEKKADELEKKKGYRPSRCLCGADNCRGYFFT